MADEDQWKEDVLRLADDFGREGHELVTFAVNLREAVEELDQDTCLALVAAFLEQLIERRTNDRP